MPLDSSSQARVSAHGCRDPAKPAWAKHFFTLALFWLMSPPYLGRATSHPIDVHERGNMISWQPPSIPCNSRNAGQLFKTYGYQNPVEGAGKHQARAVIGWGCHSATMWKVFSSGQFARVSATVCSDPDFRGCTDLAGPTATRSRQTPSGPHPPWLGAWVGARRFNLTSW